MENGFALKLYKLCCTEDNIYGECLVDELGWINDTQFCIWISYHYLDEFMKDIKNIFGIGLFDDGGFYANMRETSVCIDLCEVVGNYLDLEKVFPREKYKH